MEPVSPSPVPPLGSLRSHSRPQLTSDVSLTFPSARLLPGMWWRTAAVLRSQVVQGWKGQREVNFLLLCDQALWLPTCELSVGWWRSRRWRCRRTRSYWSADSGGVMNPRRLRSYRQHQEGERPEAGSSWLHAPGASRGWHFNPCPSALPPASPTTSPLCPVILRMRGWLCCERRARAFCSARGAPASAPALGKTHQRRAVQHHFKAGSGSEAGNRLAGLNHVGTILERVRVFDSFVYKSDIKAKSWCLSDTSFISR